MTKPKQPKQKNIISAQALRESLKIEIIEEISIVKDVINESKILNR